MDPPVHLTLNYHQQDNEETCGTACAQMLLVSPVKGGPHLGTDLTVPNQDYQQTVLQNATIGLRNDIILAEAAAQVDFGAGTHPRGLQGVLKKRNKNYPNIDFEVYTSASKDEIICRIVHTLHEHRIAPVVLTSGGKHWLVVRGCNYKVVPGKPDEIEIVDISVSNPEPHSLPGDINAKIHGPHDQCGKGLVNVGGTQVDRGRPVTTFTCKAWRDGPMADVLPPSFETSSSSIPTGDLNGCFVAVCAIHAPSTGKDNSAKYKKLTCS